MKVIIAGSRGITEYKACEKIIIQEIERLEKELGRKVTEIVSGCAKGVDKIGEQFAYNHGYDLAEFPAEWERYGNKAGALRNMAMAGYGDAAILIWDGMSPGTKDMRTQMMIKGKPFNLIMWDSIDRRKL